MVKNKKTEPAPDVLADEPKAPRRDWYEYITPLLGIKWGATVTLIAYVGFYQQDNAGMVYAAWIVAAFMFLEWLAMAWREFQRRAQ